MFVEFSAKKHKKKKKREGHRNSGEFPENKENAIGTGYAAVFIHTSLYRALKLTLPGDIGGHWFSVTGRRCPHSGYVQCRFSNPNFTDNGAVVR